MLKLDFKASSFPMEFEDFQRHSFGALSPPRPNFDSPLPLSARDLAEIPTLNAPREIHVTQATSSNSIRNSKEGISLKF